MNVIITKFLLGVGRKTALWIGLAAAVAFAAMAIVRKGRLEAEAELAIRKADARIRAMQTAKETRHEVLNADLADLKRRLDRWMQRPSPPSK